MGEVEGFRFFSCEPKRKYCPNPPPRPPRDALEYCRSVRLAPHSALTTSAIDYANEVKRFPVSARCRVRRQTGLTNRWRLPEMLGADLLGASQALKALSTPLNERLLRQITAEGPKTPICDERDRFNRPYRFRVTSDRFKSFESDENCVVAQRLASSERPSSSSGSTLKESLAKSFESLHASIIPGCIPPVKLETARHQDVFAYLSRRISSLRYPDAVLHCLGLRFHLHEPFLQKSKTLTEMFLTGKQEMLPPLSDDACHDGDDAWQRQNVPWSNPCFLETTELMPNVRNHMRCPHDCADIPPVNLRLEISDPQITPLVMAVALGNLYRDKVEIMTGNLGGVLLAADLLGFPQLEEGCAGLMVGNVTWETVCYFYSAAVKCSRKDVEFACLAWLDLNLVPQLSYHVELGQLPIDGLIRVLKSPRLFTYDEFTLYKVCVFWLFLQLNPHIEKMPSYATVMAHFNSFPKVCSALEREEGHPFLEVFLALRLHGIIDMEQVQDLQMTNVLPQSWVIKILAGNYKSLNSGGDMTSLIHFEMDAIRRGYIILTDQEPYEHTEIVAMFGFFFELKSIRREVKGSYDFWIQRLKPSDPSLTVRDGERETFSKRSDRDVMYSVCVQHYDERQDVARKDSERQTQRFGLGHKTSCGKVFHWIGLKEPLYVTFTLYMPPS